MTCISQVDEYYGSYYNGKGTDLVLNSDSTFWVHHSPKTSSCISITYSSSGIWKYSNHLLTLIPNLGDSIYPIKPRLSFSDSLFKDTIYFQFSTASKFQPVPFVEVLLVNSKSKTLAWAFSDFNGLCKLPMNEFDELKIETSISNSISIPRNQLNGNFIKLIIEPKGFEQYLTEKITLMPSHGYKLKIINGKIDGQRFIKRNFK